MTLAKLLATLRLRLDDKAQAALLYSDDDLVDAINKAVDEAAERAWLIFDTTTAACCQITLVPGQREYPLHASVFEVRKAQVTGQRCAMRRGTFDWVESRTHGDNIPQEYGVDLFGAVLHLILDRAPMDAGTLDLSVFRRQLAPMELADKDTVEPEIASTFHMDMLQWAIHLCYSTRDSDAGDDQKAQLAATRFEAAFGIKIDANVRRQQLRHRPPICRATNY